MVTEINPALCQGCGTCVAACPAGAITGTGFSNEQIMAQIEGLLHALERAPARGAPSRVSECGMTAMRRQTARRSHRASTLRAGHPRLHLQLVQLPGRRPGRHGAHRSTRPTSG